MSKPDNNDPSPFVTEVIRNALTSIAEEMSLNVMRAARSPLLREAGDLSSALTDADGTCHEMLGLLPLQTSFAKRKLHLGYRSVTASAGPFAGHFAAHEFHYASTIAAKGPALFAAKDAEGNSLGGFGLIMGNICGSFIHLIEKQ